MDSLTKQIETAIEASSISTLTNIFLSPAYLTLGSGEQRTIHALFLNTSLLATKGFLQQVFSSSDLLRWLENTCLCQLPIVVNNCADNKVRKALFDYLIGDNVKEYEHAARILGTLRMDDEVGNSYYHAPAEKCDVYVQMAECYLIEDQCEAADAAVTKAGTVLGSLSDPDQVPRALRLRYKSTYARVLDFSRKFRQAATQYYELSQAFEDANEEELIVMLGRAATCAILAPSGPQRQVVLGLICNDNRIQQLGNLPEFQTHITILQKMYNQQILYPNNFSKFQSTLSPHQQVTGADGFTILQRSVMQHNMTAISKLYTNIYYKDLAQLLGGVEEEKAVEMAARMIVNQSLNASMDEVDRLLTFNNKEGYDYDAVSLEWDDAITNLCMKLNQVTDAIRVYE